MIDDSYQNFIMFVFNMEIATKTMDLFRCFDDGHPYQNQDYIGLQIPYMQALVYYCPIPVQLSPYSILLPSNRILALYFYCQVYSHFSTPSS